MFLNTFWVLDPRERRLMRIAIRSMGQPRRRWESVFKAPRPQVRETNELAFNRASNKRARSSLDENLISIVPPALPRLILTGASSLLLSFASAARTLAVSVSLLTDRLIGAPDAACCDCLTSCSVARTESFFSVIRRASLI